MERLLSSGLLFLMFYVIFLNKKYVIDAYENRQITCDIFLVVAEQT